MNEEEIQGIPVMTTLAEEARVEYGLKSRTPKALGRMGIKSLSRSRRMASQRNRARPGTPFRYPPSMKIERQKENTARAREASKNNGSRRR